MNKRNSKLSPDVQDKAEEKYVFRMPPHDDEPEPIPQATKVPAEKRHTLRGILVAALIYGVSSTVLTMMGIPIGALLGGFLAWAAYRAAVK